MAKQYRILKGTVSQLQIIDDSKELGSDNNVGLIAMIGALITGAFGVAAALLTTLSVGSITLEGKKFSCYVGRKFVEGKLTHISFNNGDYVEMVVDKSDDDNYYQSYAVRIPKTHALYFPHAVDTPTFRRLKYSAIIAGALCFFNYLIIILVVFFAGSYEDFLYELVSFALITFIVFFVLTIMFFLLAGGRYSFIGNRIFATLGYPKPWSHDTSVEHERFKKLNRSGDPELYDDPQTPEFERIKIRDAKATYYCRTPIVPDWVEVIDERGFTPDIDNQ
ncbi:putative type VI secretion system effector [Gilliamella sp. CG16]|uniref:putative type VI secretion system effector n=1 Tax=Gilliamella sp. CG16 TaxID=3351503 RepID=UPI003987DDE0